LARTLREQCPWDIEQTHTSLIPHLLEETYEVVDALQALDPDDPATDEDLIEELIGEIVDEFDHEEEMVERLHGGDLRVQARMSMDEVSELVGVDLPEGDWDTIGGLMFHLLGHVPFEGESTTQGEFRLRAEQVKGRRIGMVRIERLTQ
jgi:CBS domain containing-hemolysin-like protein